MVLPSRAHTLRSSKPSIDPGCSPTFPHCSKSSSRSCSPTYSTRLVVAILLASVSAGSRHSVGPLAVAPPLRSGRVSVRCGCRLRPFSAALPRSVALQMCGLVRSCPERPYMGWGFLRLGMLETNLGLINRNNNDN